MTVDDLIHQVRAAITSKTALREPHERVIEQVRNSCMANAHDPTEKQSAAVREALDALEPIDTDLDELRARLSELETAKARDDAAAGLSRQFVSGAASPNYQENSMSRTSITSEPHTYQERSEHHFLRDLYAQQVLHDPGAGERLNRHAHEMSVDTGGMQRRDVSSGAAGAFVPPTYLVDLWTDLARAGRPFANILPSVSLPPDGMSFQIPRVTTGTTVADQTSENATISETDIDETTLTVPLVTTAGMQDVSRQSLDRSQIFETVIFSDLAADYAAKLDAGLLNGTGANGQNLGVRTVSGITTVTYTDANPTVPEVWPLLSQAISAIASNRYQGPSHWVMHPRRWAWFTAALDTATRPLITPTASGPTNAAGITLDPGSYGGGVVGTLQGLPVVVDGNIPTTAGAGTEDVIVCVQAGDLILLEDNAGAPVQLRYEQPNSSQLSVRLIAFGYSAFASARQPKSIAVITGTGLIAPW